MAREKQKQKHVLHVVRTPPDTNQWLDKHIPHRVRAGLANSDLLKGHLGSVPQFARPSREHKIAWRCITDSLWEGRLAAIRWLIEFVGIKGTRTLPPQVKVAKKDPDCPDDIRIDDLPNGDPFPANDPDAQKLANFWSGCSKASGHATDKSGHPPLENADRDEVMGLLMRHLDNTIYKDEPVKIAARALRPGSEG